MLRWSNSCVIIYVFDVHSSKYWRWYYSTFGAYMWRRLPGFTAYSCWFTRLFLLLIYPALADAPLHSTGVAAHLLCCGCWWPTLLLLLLLNHCCFETTLLWLLLTYSVGKWLTNRGKPGGVVLNSTFNWLLKTIPSGGTRDKLKVRILDAYMILILACYWTPAVHKMMVDDRGWGKTANLFLQCILLQILSPLCFQSAIAARQDKILFSSIFKSFYSSQDWRIPGLEVPWNHWRWPASAVCPSHMRYCWI